MTKRYCDTGRIECPHLPECIWDCKYDTAVAERRNAESKASMSRVCDAGAFCLQRPQCEYRCHFTDAVLEPEQETRKVKPYPAIPPDIDPVPDTWHTVGTVMLTAIMGALAVVCILIFFTGLWIWSLLI